MKCKLGLLFLPFLIAAGACTTLGGPVEGGSLQEKAMLVIQKGHSMMVNGLGVSPDRYFDASRNGGPLVALVDGDDAYGIDQFALAVNRLDIILERLGSPAQEVIDHCRSQYRKRMRCLGLSPLRPACGTVRFYLGGNFLTPEDFPSMIGLL